MSMSHHSLRLESLSLSVHLGCLADERKDAQEVRWSVELRFPSEPKGCRSDEIADTISYADIADVLRAHCESGEFKLIERLAVEGYEKLRAIVKPPIQMLVELHKVRPPVEDLHGGSHYRCGDFLP